jgi:hypothetical protein
VNERGPIFDLNPLYEAAVAALPFSMDNVDTYNAQYLYDSLTGGPDAGRAWLDLFGKCDPHTLMAMIEVIRMVQRWERSPNAITVMNLYRHVNLFEDLD